MVPVPGVARLIAELEADPGIASGERRFRRRIRRDEAADVADFAHGEVERAAAARERAAIDAGTPLVCGEGCACCCEELIMVAAPEEATVTRWLGRDENRAAREAFLAAYEDWRRRVGGVPERLAELTARGEIEEHQRLYLAQYRKRVLCAFNREGLCLVYPVRPIGCRSAHALETADYCRADHPSGRAPRRFHFAPFDEALARGHDLMRAAHHAMGAPRGKPRALCASVHERLTGSAPRRAKPPGRNSPCPCGSGKKYKRCCGS